MKQFKKMVCLTAALLSACAVTGAVCGRRAFCVEAKMQEVQQKLAGEVLRFHVLANSDSEEDQLLKMQVKEEVLRYMKQELPQSENAGQTKQWVKSHQKELEETARNTIRQHGYDYTVKAELATDMFPEKKYGDVTFPAGRYEALRIEIGDAEGQNWWCVLYPNLCFIDAVRAVVPEEGKQELKSVLADDEYEMVTATSKFRIKWFFFGRNQKITGEK